MGARPSMGTFASRRWLLAGLALVGAGGLAWSQDPDTVRAALAGLDPRVVVTVLGVGVAAAGLRLLTRPRRRRAAAARIAPAPPPADHGPPYTVHFNHEVRTPITAILGYTEMLSASEATRSERVDFLEAVRRNCQTLARLVDETLAFARTESGDLTPLPQEVALAELLEEPLLMVRPEAAARRLTIAVSVEGRVPARVSTDVFFCRQVIVHLLRTAVHLSTTGQVRVVLRVAGTAGDRLEIDVHDTHPALAQSVRATLFDPWKDSTLEYVDVLEGAGLRLAIARRLAEKLGGTVSAGPTTSTGGLYRLALPSPVGAEVACIEGDELFDRSARKPRDERATPLRGRVLVVEAASEIGWMLRTVVAGRGVEVETCSTSADAWDRLAGPVEGAEPWSALIVDLEDPGVDGLLLVQRLRLDRAMIPIIAVGGGEALPPSCADGMTILPKPARVLNLYDAVRPYLQSAA
jgi:signal transduction histidine kinase/CheY-like chemotaxis protein